MCGRYWIDGEEESEIQKSLDKFRGHLEKKTEVAPGSRAQIILQNEEGIFTTQSAIWGFSHFDPNKKSVIFNTRSETARKKQMFKNAVEKSRCLIPISGFFEWTDLKQKYRFTSQENSIMYVAGIYQMDRFSMLTTVANSSMKPIHNRIPLILETDDLEDWLTNDKLTEELLKKIPLNLNKDVVGQMGLFI